MSDRCPHCNCVICKCDRYPDRESVMALREEVDRLRSALTEIRDVARVSEGVEFYAMLADKALTGK